jgi:putative sigma-54 modulation protein
VIAGFKTPFREKIMDINVSARHFNASANLQARIQEEVEKLGKFYPNITGANVVLDHEVDHLRRCEISINISGGTIVASADEENMGKAIDVALERAKVQLKKQNEKQKDHKGQPIADLVD